MRSWSCAVMEGQNRYDGNTSFAQSRYTRPWNVENKFAGPTCRGNIIMRQLCVSPFLVSLSRTLYFAFVRPCTDGLLRAICTFIVRGKYHFEMLETDLTSRTQVSTPPRTPNSVPPAYTCNCTITALNYPSRPSHVYRKSILYSRKAIDTCEENSMICRH